MSITFSLMLLVILGYLSSTTASAAPSKNRFSSSLMYSYFKHTNEEYNTSESGWLPGINLNLSHKNGNMRGIIAADLYIGDAEFIVKNGSSSNITTATDEKFVQFSYRLENNKPSSFYQFYGVASLQRWNRDINSNNTVTGISRKYEWWTIEAGMQLNIMRSTPNLFHVNLGITRSLFNEIQIDLRKQNLGKPLFKPSEDFGVTTSINFVHRFRRNKGIRISADARYWRFSEATRSVDFQGQKTVITESASESLLITTKLSYFFHF